MTASALTDLESELDSIYNDYRSNSHHSTDTLDSQKNQAGNVYRSHLPRMHISSRLSSLQTDEDVVRSAPMSPTSHGSFDFNIRNHPAMTNSSLNVLVSNDEKKEEFVEVPDDEWTHKGAAVKTLSIGDSPQIIRRSVTDFKFGKSLGEGSYSTVVLATDKHTKKNYACKILDKTHIIKEKKVKYVNIEKHALNRLSNRMGIISLYFTFQDKASLYFVLDYASNGELLSLIKKHNTLNEDCVRHFGAQILDAIKYMHDNGVIHRDIKPENILLDSRMRIQITDFGTARLLEKKNDESEEYPLDVRAKSFVGTAEYVSPELLESKYCGKPGDIWAFGCIIYQMIAGKPPFKATNEYLTFQKITKLQYAFSAGFPTIIRDLIKQILVLQPSKRATIPKIQKHYFFQSVDFDNFEAIWETPPPEIGPYKMTAKSMQKMPELPKSVSSPIIKKPAKKPARAEKLRSFSEGGKAMSPASAAAFVLNKQNPSEGSLGDSSDSQTEEPAPAPVRKQSTPDYIPGTNILRPTINNRAAFRSSSSTKKTVKKAAPRVLDVAPLSSVEVAWGEFLKHPDERIIKVGPVNVYRDNTEAFEKRHKGLLHNSPLGMANKMQGVRSSASMLSQVANGSSTGLRGPSAVPNTAVDENENNAIINYFEIEEIDPPSSPSNASEPDTESSEKSSGSKASALFKKLRLTHDKKESGNDEASSGSGGVERKHPLEKTRMCTLVITTHGRALILLRTESTRLISEIKLNYSFIQFKELISSGGKFQKTPPNVGIFVIESTETVFVFEVEKYDVNQWTEALARAKLNQIERTKINDSRPSSGASHVSSSPKLADSPAFTSKTHHRSVSNGPDERAPQPHDRVSSAPATPVQRAESEQKPSHMMAAKIRNRTSVRRKPPPIASSNGLDMSTGLAPHFNGNGNGLQAAVLAVTNTPVSVVQNRHSSFTKEDRQKYRGPITVHSKNTGNVTQSNSKLLSRSQRTK